MLDDAFRFCKSKIGRPLGLRNIGESTRDRRRGFGDRLRKIGSGLSQAYQALRRIGVERIRRRLPLISGVLQLLCCFIELARCLPELIVRVRDTRLRLADRATDLLDRAIHERKSIERAIHLLERLRAHLLERIMRFVRRTIDRAHRSFAHRTHEFSVHCTIERVRTGIGYLGCNRAGLFVHIVLDARLFVLAFDKRDKSLTEIGRDDEYRIACSCVELVHRLGAVNELPIELVILFKTLHHLRTDINLSRKIGARWHIFVHHAYAHRRGVVIGIPKPCHVVPGIDGGQYDQEQDDHKSRRNFKETKNIALEYEPNVFHARRLLP